MSANVNPIFPLTVQSYAQTFELADTTDVKTLFTGGVNGSRVDSISAVSTDTTIRLFTVYMNDGTTNHAIGEISIGANVGSDGTTKVQSLLTPGNLPWLDTSGSLYLKAGWYLKLGLKTGSISSTKKITIISNGGDY